MVTPKKT
jgi:hypothetical protein